ncbi:MAG TPA: histidine phosphatase family protein [Pirellulales bacterium]|nr:histidine phosphatase family protein [Pirellulales bacterium]
MTDQLPKLYLARHGETEWSRSGQHTSHTDIPLTARGEENARRLVERLKGIVPTTVFTSPLIRARRTCELAGYGPVAVVEPDLVEWDYGDYEGRRTVDIRQERPGWRLFRDGCPNGESFEAVRERADRVIARIRTIEGDVLAFGHSHFLRILTARWLGLPVADARLLVLSTASLSILGYEHALDEPAIRLWNDDRHLTEFSSPAARSD